VLGGNNLTQKISIITPFFNEKLNVVSYFASIMPVLHGLDVSYEIVCVDDGSSDATAQQISALMAQYPCIKLIKLSRNFGKEAAVTAGLEHASGDALVLMDADLQDPPDVLVRLLQKWQEGYKVVLAKRTMRSDGFWKDSTARAYHFLIERLTNGMVPANVGDYRLMDRKVVNALSGMRERNRYLKGMMAWVGFRTCVVEYERPKRIIGETKIGYKTLWRLAIDGIVGFSSYPLEIWSLVGLFFMGLSLILWLSGVQLVIAAIMWFSGLNMLATGVMGYYIGRIMQEVRGRPLYIIDEVINGKDV
jgi:glycosyltransferase involved in cell wall biosynthesis